jgi:hypothetical protein
MVDPDAMSIEQRLRDLLTDDHLAVRVPAGAIEAVEAGVRRRRRTRLAGAGGVAAVAVAAAAFAVPAVLHRTARVSPGDVTSETRGIWTPSPYTTVPTMTAPSVVAVSGGIVWVAGPAAGTDGGDVLARMDATSRRVTTMAAGAVSDMAATPRRLWVALRQGARTASSCNLELRETTKGQIVSTFPLPCDTDGGSPPVVTANGTHAWVATDDGSRTHLRLYTAGSSAPTAERILPGRLAGPHLLAIGGTSVYVVTLDADDGATLHQLSAARLVPIASTAAPGARLIAYGSEQVYVADADAMVAYPPDLSSRRSFATGHVTALTTGAGLVWCDLNGDMFSGLDPHTGEIVGVSEVPAQPGGLLRADGAILWAVDVYAGVGVRVQSAQPAS